MESGQSTMHLLRDVTRTFARVQRRAFSCCGPASETQCLALTALGPGEALPVSELATRLGTDVAWASRTVEQLHRSGDVERLADPSDRRVARVRLTPAGEHRASELQQALDDHAEAILRAIPEERREAVLEALRLLQGALRSVERDAAPPVELQ